MTRDLSKSVKVSPGTVAALSTDTAISSPVVDTQGYDGLMFAIFFNTLTDANATFAVLVEHDDASGFGTATAVSDSDLIGTEAAAGFQYDDDNETRKIVYIGSKRYVRLTVTPTGNTGTDPIAILPILGFPKKAPVA